MFFCRMHGEPLVRNEAKARWECPEVSVCGTYINYEAQVVGTAVSHSIQDPFTGQIFATMLLS